MVEMKFDEAKNNLKLPKNIRQVGKPGEKMKIYVEDYVITYINQIARESADQQCLAVLLGRVGKMKGETVAFINGAVKARNVSVQDDTAVFTSEDWTQIYDEIGQYFHDTEVVGWFLTRPGKSLGINDKITKIHVDNFPGADKALFIVDPQDNDEAFYIYEQGELVRQAGYYIYYERNEDMQNYMVDHKSGESEEQQTANAFLKKKEEIMERRQAQKKEKSRNPLFSRLSSISGNSSAQKPDTASERKSEGGVKADGKADGLKQSDAGNTADTAGEKRKALSGDFLKGMRRAGSVAATFVILFALIFGFSQINRKNAQETGNLGADAQVPVDVAQGELDTQSDVNDPSSGDLSAADGVSGADGEGLSAADDAGADGEGLSAADNDGADGEGLAAADDAASEDQAAAAGNHDVSADGTSESGTDMADASDGADNSGGAETEVPANTVIRQYEVREGDTLAGISEQFYDSYNYIELIQEMNQIEDPDMIYPGMMLNLPDEIDE